MTAVKSLRQRLNLKCLVITQKEKTWAYSSGKVPAWHVWEPGLHPQKTRSNKWANIWALLGPLPGGLPSLKSLLAYINRERGHCGEPSIHACKRTLTTFTTPPYSLLYQILCGFLQSAHSFFKKFISQRAGLPRSEFMTRLSGKADIFYMFLFFAWPWNVWFCKYDQKLLLVRAGGWGSVGRALAQHVGCPGFSSQHHIKLHGGACL